MANSSSSSGAAHRRRRAATNARARANKGRQGGEPARAALGEAASTRAALSSGQGGAAGDAAYRDKGGDEDGDGDTDLPAAEQCAQLRERHDVRPGTSWGTLTEEGRARWVQLDCDHADPEQARKRGVESAYLDEYAQRLRTALDAREPTRRISSRGGGSDDNATKPGGGSGGPASSARSRQVTTLSVCVCTTSRHTEATRLEQLALFAIMLPSLRDTLLPRARGRTRKRGTRAHASAFSERITSWFDSVAAIASGGDREGGVGGSDGGGTSSSTSSNSGGAGGSGSEGGGRSSDSSGDGSSDGSDGGGSSSDGSDGLGGGASRGLRSISARVGSPRRAVPAFEYRLYVLYDVGDAFFDSAEREAEVSSWIASEIVAPLAAAGVILRFALLRFDNVLRKPGPAFNFMMAAAADDGADYLYRVNDDTQVRTARVACHVWGTCMQVAPPGVLGCPRDSATATAGARIPALPRGVQSARHEQVPAQSRVPSYSRVSVRVP